MLRANHAPHVSKALRKAIRKDLALKTYIAKKQDNHSLRAYKKQKKFVADSIKI